MAVRLPIAPVAGAPGAAPIPVAPAPDEAQFVYDLQGLHRMPVLSLYRFVSTGGQCKIAFTVRDTNRGNIRGIIGYGRLPDANNAYLRLVIGYPKDKATGRSRRMDHAILCRGSGLFYIGPITWAGTALAMESNTDLRRYWQEMARRQYGCHVHVEAPGILRMALMQLTGDNFQVNDSVAINQVYPIVRFEIMPTKQVPAGALKDPKTGKATTNHEHWDQLIGIKKDSNGKPVEEYGEYYGFYWLCVGLMYRAFDPTKYSTIGDRYYVRSEQYLESHRWGGVYELTDDNMDTKLGELKDNAITKFAVYVCAGAKLVLVDQYQQQIAPNCTHHNRTLVQAGGLVVVEGTLRMKAPFHGQVIQYFQLENVGVQHWRRHCLQSPATHEANLTAAAAAPPAPANAAAAVDAFLEEKARITCPVLFLGANESEFGSIAWALAIEHDLVAGTGLPEPERRCVLTIPEGGRFEAITHWSPGIVEVQARHRYERLHEATVGVDPVCPLTRADKPFEVPPEPQMAKILGIGEDRTVYTDINMMSAAYWTTKRAGKDREPFPIVSTGYRCVQWPPREQKKDLKPFVRPDWPLIKHRLPTIPATYKYIYRKENIGYMSTRWSQTTLTAADTTTIQPRDQLYECLADNQKATYDKQPQLATYDVFAYKRQPFGQSVPKTEFDGWEAYVGIDGYAYRKDSAYPKAVGRYKAVNYERPQAEIDAQMARRITPPLPLPTTSQKGIFGNAKKDQALPKTGDALAKGSTWADKK